MWKAGPTHFLHSFAKTMGTATSCKGKGTNEHLLQLAIQSCQAISQVKTLCEEHWVPLGVRGLIFWHLNKCPPLPAVAERGPQASACHGTGAACCLLKSKWDWDLRLSSLKSPMAAGPLFHLRVSAVPKHHRSKGCLHAKGRWAGSQGEPQHRQCPHQWSTAKCW